MTYEEVRNVAADHNLGHVTFEERVALNTGRTIEVGYVYVDHKRQLFCKRQSNSDSFYLCNQFRELT